MSELYSIRDAARAAGVPEEKLRRAILTGELVAQPTADDRHYLIRSDELRRFAGMPEPAESEDGRCCGRPSFFRMVVALTLVAVSLLFIAQLTPRRLPAVCLDCGAVMERSGAILTPCGTLPTTNIRETHLTQMIREGYPDACDHDWRLAAPPAQGRPESALSTVSVMDRAGIFTRAAKVDAGGAADLVRWALRNPLTPERLQLLPATEFETAGDFRAWFEKLRGAGPKPLPEEPF